MSKKNKIKNKNKGKNMPDTTSLPPKEVVDFSPEQIDKIEMFVQDEMPQEADTIEQDQLVETKEDEFSIAEIRRTGNVDRYIDLLRDKLKRLNALKAKVEEFKDANESAKKDLAEAKKKFEDERKSVEKELADLRAELNIREKKLQEEQLAIDNGEYTSVIQSLLESLRATEEDITNSTKELVVRLGEKHKTYLDSLSKLKEKEQEIETKIRECENARAEIERERKKLEFSKSSFEKHKRIELEDEFNDRIEELEDENASLKRKVARLEKEINSISDFRQQISAVFDSTDAEAMLVEQQTLLDKIKELEAEISNRHSNTEYEEKAQAVEVLKNKVRELEEKISEERLSELRLSLHNANAYILEINTYKAKIDSAEARERSLLRTVDDLHQTINRLKDEEKVKEAAFEQARRMDNNQELQLRKLRRLEPSSLRDLVVYIQRYMATSRDPEPFYYEQKTIRTFLAGLHMSPLSILQGISGTGKTSLPREVAKALVAASEGYTGKDEAGNRNEPYRICAIQSGWRDNMDLIGFYNNFEKKYKETDFFKAIYLAAQPKYKNTLFFIILDEMNLSHPEHYFADFLSMMEQSVNDRYVKIQADEDILPKLITERQMQLPPNIRFIGTANHDETTLDFAPKTYDRSNVMVMGTNDSELVMLEIDKTAPSKLSISYDWLLSQFNEAEKKYLYRYEEFDKFIKITKLKEELKERGIGIGNRFDKQARKFICVYIALSGDSVKYLAEATDHLITSRLFRSLKNRYDLTADNLEKFQKFYSELFKKTFGGEEPQEGDKLLLDEIAKK